MSIGLRYLAVVACVAFIAASGFGEEEAHVPPVNAPPPMMAPAGAPMAGPRPMIDGCSVLAAPPGKMMPPPAEISPDKIDTAIQQLGTSSWSDAQVFLVSAGKAAIPGLIHALTDSDPAFNLGGHTKADAGRIPRQRTIGEVCAELLNQIVSDHSNYKGDLPGLDPNAWREWWDKNAATVTFAAN